MKRRPALFLLAAGTILHAQPAPDAAGLPALVDRARASAMRYRLHLPDFTCTKIMVRKEGDSASITKWRTADTLEEAVSFASDGRASYHLVTRNNVP